VNRGSLPAAWRGIVLLALLLAPATALAAGPLVVIRAGANLREGTSLASPVVARLCLNQTLTTQGGRVGEWRQAATAAGQAGYVRADMVSDLWLRVLLAEGVVELLSGRTVLASYPAAIGPVPLPEGRHFVCQARSAGKDRLLLLSLPGPEEARRALAAGRIDRRTYRSILLAVRAGRVPDQGTVLGGGAGIANGRGRVAPRPGRVLLADRDFAALQARLPKNCRVEVQASARRAAEDADPARVGAAVAAGAAEQLKNPAAYQRPEPGPFRLAYPGGDIQPDLACDADVLVRAVRKAGLDLQVLVHEDVLVDPAAYAGLVTAPDPDIDHRRSDVLAVFLSRRAENLPRDPKADPLGFAPGDLVLLDAVGGRLIGVLEARLGASGLPRVVTVSGPGRRVESQDLLGRVPVAGHFRLLAPLEYR
jgi:uncharacterized protein YijF (DUF1287 family)